jgi:tyrosinase
MPIEIKINNSLNPNARYITYAPSPCQIRQAPAAGALTVTLTSQAASAGGGVAVFYANRVVGAQPAASLTVTLPADGTWVDFGLGGKQGAPSLADLDCLLIATGGGTSVTVPLMVRVRKNANKLKPQERDRFLVALAKLNSGTPAPSTYQALRNMHVEAGDPEEHRGPQFLPWHRSYLLDLERGLQAIDPSVSMHYWRFDQPAPNVFTKLFMGETKRSTSGVASLVTLDPGNPLVAWVTDSVPGILRSSVFNTKTESAPGGPGFPLINQAQTLALGPSYAQFVRMEGSPHGAAHVSFNGSVSEIENAPKDPLFFMLHANVDRLWAMWQWINHRVNPDDLNSYQGQNRDGRRVDDTMWPWNGVITPPRPDFAPGTGLPGSPVTATPGSKPAIRNMIDYHGSRVAVPLDWLGFSYDDVPFEFNP